MSRRITNWRCPKCNAVRELQTRCAYCETKEEAVWFDKPLSHLKFKKLAMTKPKPQFRQGDVLVERVEVSTPIMTAVPREGGKVVLAYGEATGHAHAIAEPKVKRSAFRDEQHQRARIQISDLEISQALAELCHEEHATIPLERGNYLVIRQREYSPEAIRNVAD